MRRMRPQWSSSSDNNVGNSSTNGVNVSPPMQTTSERICPRRLRALRIGRKRLENELLRYPKNASAYQSLGFILYEQGEYGECISALETATVLGQYSSRLLSTLGRALYNVGNNWIRAVQCLESAATISNDPTRRKGLDPDHWAYLAHAYAANLQPESSIHVLNKYLLPEVCRNRLKSLKQLRRGSEKVRFLKETGKLLSAIGQKEEIDPRKHTRTCFGGVGVLHLFCSSQEQKNFLKSLEHAREDVVGVYSLHTCKHSGRLTKAIVVAVDKNRAYRKGSHTLPACTSRSNRQHSSGNKGSNMALNWYRVRQAWAIRNGTGEFHARESITKTHTDFQSAFVHSRLAVDEASTWIVLGQTLLSIHDDFGAIDSFQHARIRDPNSREAMFHLIKLYSNCRMAKARDDLLKELDVSLEPMLDVADMSEVLEASSDDETIQLLQKQLEIERTKFRMLHNEMQTLFLQTDSIQQGRVLVAESQPLHIINLDCDAEISNTPETTNGDEPVVDVEQLNEALDHVCCQLQALEQQRHVIVDRIKSLKRQLQYEFASAKHYMLSQNRNTSKLPPSPLSLPGGMTIRLHRTGDEYSDIPPLITAQLIETLVNASDSVLSVTEASVLFRALNGDIVAAVAAVHENPFLVQTVKDSCSAAALHLCSLGNSIKKVEGSHLIEEAHRDLHQRWKQIKQKRLLGVEVNSDQHFEKEQRKSRVKNRRKLFKKRQFENSHKRAGLCMITEKVCEEVNHELVNCASQEFAKCGTEDEKLSQNEIVDNSRKLLQDEMVKGSARSNTTTSSIDTLQSNATAGKTPEVIRANVEGKVENEYNKHPIRKRRSNRSTTRRAQLPDENSFEQSATTNGIAGDNSGGDDTINTQEHFNEPELEVEDSPWDLSEKQSDENLKKHVVKRTSSAAVQHSTDDAEGEVPVLARKRSFKNRKIRKTFHAAQLLLQSFSSEINVLDPKNNTNSNSDSSSSNASSDEESVKTDVSGDELFAEGTSPKSATFDYDNDEFDNESNISQSDNESNKCNSQNDNERNNSQNEFGSDQKDVKDADTAPENAAAISLNANLNSNELDVGSKADMGGVPVLNTRSNVTRAMASLKPPSDQNTISSSQKVFNSKLGLNSMTSQDQQQHSTVKKGGMKTLGELGVSTRRKNSYLKKAKNRRTSRSGMLKRNNTMSVLEENSHDSIRHDHRKDSTNSAPDDIGKEITNLKGGLFSTELVHAENLSREESNTRQVVSSSASDLNASFDQHEVSIGMKQSSGTEMSIQTDKEGVQTQQEDGKGVGIQQEDGKVVEMQQEDGKGVEVQQEDGKGVEMQQEDGEEQHIDHYALLGQAPPMTLEQLNSHSSKQMVLESSRKLLDYDDDDDDLFLNIDDKIDMSWPDEFQIDDSDDL